MTRPGRLFWKLFLAFWLATSLTFLVGSSLFTLTAQLPDDPQLDAQLASEAALVSRYGVQAGIQLLTVWQSRHGESAGLYDDQGQLLAGVDVPAPAWRAPLTLPEGGRVWLAATRAPGAGGPPVPGRAVPLLIGTVMSALFSGFMAYYLAWPLAYLRRAMGDVAQGRFDGRVKPRMGARRDEIVDLAEACDRMADQLKVLVQSQQRLLHDISHELRSPLTRMRAAIGLLKQDPSRTQMIDRVERESERIDTLIEELLTLARLQGRPESIATEPVDVIELLAAITEDARFEADIKGCQVHLRAEQGFVSRVSAELLYRCFENVIRNAVRYSPQGASVWVVADYFSATEQLRVLITDSGKGVEPERLTRIFLPFERGLDEPATGFGLGLAIAQRAVAMHAGYITARNEPTGGLTVEILLPQRA